jgi:hypothetical protein
MAAVRFGVAWSETRHPRLELLFEGQLVKLSDRRNRLYRVVPGNETQITYGKFLRGAY